MVQGWGKFTPKFTTLRHFTCFYKIVPNHWPFERLGWVKRKRSEVIPAPVIDYSDLSERELLFHPLEAFPVIDLLGFMDGLPEGDRPAMLGYLFEPGSPAVGKHEVRLSNP